MLYKNIFFAWIKSYENNLGRIGYQGAESNHSSIIARLSTGGYLHPGNQLIKNIERFKYMATELDHRRYKDYQVVLQVATELKKNGEEINAKAVIMLSSEDHKLWEYADTNATFYIKVSSVIYPSCTKVSRTLVHGYSSFAPPRIIGPERPCNCYS